MSINDDNRRGPKVTHSMLEAGICEKSEDNQNRPYRDLVASVLSRALLDFCGYQSPRLVYSDQQLSELIQNQKGARRWLFSKNKTEFSFKWCCEVLDLDGPFLLELIQKTQENLSSPESQTVMVALGKSKRYF